jgi:hypothetical protein
MEAVHSDVDQCKYLMVDNDKSDNYYDQQDYRMDNRFRMLADIVLDWHVKKDMLRCRSVLS